MSESVQLPNSCGGLVPLGELEYKDFTGPVPVTKAGLYILCKET